MKIQNIDTLQWTPSERLRKVLFIKKRNNTYDKSFAEALTSAKRCYDVRIVEEFENGMIHISYLCEIGVDERTGLAYMKFSSGVEFPWRWLQPVEDKPAIDEPVIVE